MIIDASQLTEVFVYNPRPMLDRSERWYVVPIDNRYAISTSGSLAFSQGGVAKWKVKKRHQSNIDGIEDGYYIKWRGHRNDEFVTISELFKITFFSGITCVLIPQKSYPSKRKWSLEDDERENIYSYHVENCHLLFSKADKKEYIQAKIEGRSPAYAVCQYKHRFINRDESLDHKKPLSDWHNMMERSLSQSRKAYRPDNEETTCCEEWLNFDQFFNWYIRNRYNYTGNYGKLALDKDAINFCRTKEYAPQYCCFIPSKVNAWLKSPYRNRKSRAKKLRVFIDEERQRAEVPEMILSCLEQWATLDEVEQTYFILGG